MLPAMASVPSSSRFSGPQRISGPAELVQAVPYLLGFHPRASLVLIGLHDAALVVTARLDLDDADDALRHTVGSLARAGSTEVVAIVFGGAPDRDPSVPLPWSAVAWDVADEVAAAGCELADALLVDGARWWSYECTDEMCCPRSGRTLPDAPSTFTTAATVAGIAVLPTRDALAAQLDPAPDEERAALLPLIEQEEHEIVAAALEAGSKRRERAAKRAVFAAARASDEPRWTPPDAEEVARFGVALSDRALRDAAWMAVDDDRLDGRALWRELAVRLPAPYQATPLFLLGWRAWRHGNGALARVAADRVLAADPQYSPADLLLAALTHGMDPRRVPRLRLPRPA
jgi:hypothetical protein